MPGLPDCLNRRLLEAAEHSAFLPLGSHTQAQAQGSRGTQMTPSAL